jgi:hypothetical protein
MHGHFIIEDSEKICFITLDSLRRQCTLYKSCLKTTVKEILGVT